MKILKFFKFRYAFLSLSEETYERYFNISREFKKRRKIMRCGVYVRVSTDDQRDNGYSIDSRLRMMLLIQEKESIYYQIYI